MYVYEHDPETGGLLLLDRLSEFSKEPRPVYSRELDILGFDAFWKYERQDESPYLWAESNFYWYRGKRVAKTVGGSLYEKPVVELERDENGSAVMPEGSELVPVDIAGMLRKNALRLASLEQLTIKKIYDVYHRHEKKLDCFHVAFSGGKDSVVLLELVKRALPRTAFMVVFGDTGMEFPDTYDTVAEVERRCREDGIAFYRAASHFKPCESWKLFGPPSRVLRWCCTVHKSVPQTLKIREILGKRDYTGMDFVGVRGHESIARSGYEYENFGKKQKGQYSFNPMLEWTSAEVWLYIHFRGLVVNAAYKKGNSRAGCLFCPHSAGKSDYFRRVNYPNEVAAFTDMIRTAVDDPNVDTYISNGGWLERRNGRDIRDNETKFSTETKDGLFVMHVNHPGTDWHEWIKTMGEAVDYRVVEREGGYDVVAPANLVKTATGRRLQQCFVKAAYCVGCGACETNCRAGALSFKQGLRIENCLHCGQCHQIEKGCLVYHSLNKPQNEGHHMKSLNTFADHAPKSEWISDFLRIGQDYLTNNSLGRMQIAFFKRFLTDAGMIEKNKTTSFFTLLQRLGATSEDAWSLSLINLSATNPQIQWYVKEFPIGAVESDKEVIELLASEGVKEKDARSIFKSFRRLCDTPLGKKINFGNYEERGRTLVSISRTKPVTPSPLVFLYGLYRFAEACGGYYEFSLSRLLDYTVESEGVSPAEIFALSRDEVEPILNGLARSNPDFISFTTTHDLELVKLADDRKASDVLALFN